MVGAKKASHYQKIQNIILQPVNEIRFLRQINYKQSTIILSVVIEYSV